MSASMGSPHSDHCCFLRKKRQERTGFGWSFLTFHLLAKKWRVKVKCRLTFNWPGQNILYFWSNKFWLLFKIAFWISLIESSKQDSGFFLCLSFFFFPYNKKANWFTQKLCFQTWVYFSDNTNLTIHFHTIS